MRILILHSRYLSGPASGENRVVQDEARLLSEGGHEVQVWEPSARGQDGLSLVRTGVAAIWSREATKEVRRLIRRGRSQIVHCHNLFPALSPAVLRAAASEGAAVVVTLHNYRLLCLPATFLRDGRPCEDCLGHIPWRGVVHRCYRDSVAGSSAYAASLTLHRSVGTFERVRLYLALSRFVRDKHIAAGVPRARIRLKSNFTWPSPVREGPGDYFLYLGRLSPEKGAATLLEVWKRRPPGRLLVVGDGPEAERLKASAPPSVQFLGLVPFSEVPRLLTGARALLVPSRSYETGSRAVLEAYAAGVPVLASRIGGNPELLVDDFSGLLLPPTDAEKWREAAERLLNDDETERLGQNAWELWRSRYSPEPALTQLRDAYEAALASN